MTDILEQLYAPKEVSDAYEQGRRYERATHRCKTKVKIVEKKVFAGFREHPRSLRRKYGVVSNGKLLNPTFDTEAEAGMFMAGLIPANAAAREHVVIDALVVQLY